MTYFSRSLGLRSRADDVRSSADSRDGFDTPLLRAFMPPANQRTASVHPILKRCVAVTMLVDVTHHLLRVKPEVAELALSDLPAHSLIGDVEVV